jgi:hypothetical protein
MTIEDREQSDKNRSFEIRSLLTYLKHTMIRQLYTNQKSYVNRDTY